MRVEGVGVRMGGCGCENEGRGVGVRVEGGGGCLPVKFCNVIVCLWKHGLERERALEEGESLRCILWDNA